MTVVKVFVLLVENPKIVGRRMSVHTNFLCVFLKIKKNKFRLRESTEKFTVCTEKILKHEHCM